MAQPNINDVAKALATSLGGTQTPMNRDGEFFDWCARIKVDMPAPMLPYTVTLSVKGYGADAGKITATLHHASAPNNDVNEHGIDWPKAGVNGKRGLDAIIIEIARRVCNAPAAQIALAEYAKREREHKARADGVLAHLANLERLPNVKQSQNYRATAHQGRIFNNGGVSFDASVSPSGDVCFSRIGSVSLDQARRILAILGEV